MLVNQCQIDGTNEVLRILTSNLQEYLQTDFNLLPADQRSKLCVAYFIFLGFYGTYPSRH